MNKNTKRFTLLLLGLERVNLRLDQQDTVIRRLEQKITEFSDRIDELTARIERQEYVNNDMREV